MDSHWAWHQDNRTQRCCSCLPSRGWCFPQGQDRSFEGSHARGWAWLYNKERFWLWEYSRSNRKKVRKRYGGYGQVLRLMHKDRQDALLSQHLGSFFIRVLWFLLVEERIARFERSGGSCGGCFRDGRRIQRNGRRRWKREARVAIRLLDGVQVGGQRSVAAVLGPGSRTF